MKDEPRERRFGRWLRIITRLAGVAAVLGMAFWVLWRDEPPPKDEDLRGYRREVKDEDNGFRLVDLTQDDVAWPREDEEEALVHGNSATFDTKKAAEIATSNASVFEKIDLALARPDFQLDMLQGMDAPVPHLLGWRSMAYGLASRSRLHIEEERPQQAYEDALRLIRLGSRIQGAQGTLIESHVGIAVQAIGNQGLVHMAVHGHLPTQILRRAIVDLAPEVRRKGLGDVFKAEYVWMADTFDRFAAGTFSDPDFAPGYERFRYFFRLNETKRLFAEHIRNLIGLDAMPASSRKALELSDYDPDFLEVILFRSAGKKVLQFLLPVYEPALTQSDIAHVSLAATRVLLALMTYREEKGTLPVSLQALVPAYLESLPLDPYTGKEFRYSPEKMMLYSPGADGLDSGGSTKEEAWEALTDAQEPTLRLDPAAWKLKRYAEELSDDGVEE